MRTRSLTLLAAVVVLGILAGASIAARATPRWQTVPGATADDRKAVWGAGRVWIFNNGTADTGQFTAKNSRVVNGRLSSWATTKLPNTRGWVFDALLGQDLIFSTSSSSDTTLQAVRLRPDGTFGRPADVGGAPTPSSSSGSPVIRLRDRAVRLADGKPGAEPPHLGACCDVNGAVVDYSSFAPPSTMPVGILGLDRHGRLWLAWTPYRPGRKQQAQMVELDTATLLPHGKPTTVPGSVGFTSIVDLACADVCRIVMQGVSRSSRATNFSWAPGERSPTTIRPPGTYAGVIGARVSAGHLVVAYWARSATGGLTVGVARGDPRGAHLQPRSSITTPPALGGTVATGIALEGVPAGIFGPGGFAAITVYSGGQPYKAAVRVAILPL